MSIPHFLKDWWQGRGARAKHFAKWANQMATALNNMEGIAPILIEFTGDTFVFRLVADAGSVLVPIKITAAKATTHAGYYDGSVYGDGVLEAATATDQPILLAGFDIDDTVTQGFYWGQARIVDLSGEKTTYQVLPGHPIPPAAGTNTLLATGTLETWEETAPCVVP